MSQRPARQWKSNSALYHGVASRVPDLQAPIIPRPGPRCQGISYSPSSLGLSVGVPMSAAVPIIAGASPRYWCTTPGLPAGLTMNNGTGAISGTPTTPQGATMYTVRAIHSDDVATTTVTITIT